MSRRILITGSRDWIDRLTIEAAILSYADEDTTIVHGGARGADSMAGAIARTHGMIEEVHPAAWDTKGRGAGLIRNAEMVDAGADVCLAFIRNQSRGATHCSGLAIEARIPTEVYEDDRPHR